MTKQKLASELNFFLKKIKQELKLKNRIACNPSEINSFIELKNDHKKNIDHVVENIFNIAPIKTQKLRSIIHSPF